MTRNSPAATKKFSPQTQLCPARFIWTILLTGKFLAAWKEFYPVFLGAHASSVLQMSRSTGRSIFSHVRRARRKEIWQMTNDQ